MLERFYSTGELRPEREDIGEGVEVEPKPVEVSHSWGVSVEIFWVLLYYFHYCFWMRALLHLVV